MGRTIYEKEYPKETLEEQTYDILILDEPFNALDYKTYNDVKEIIRTLQAEGKTILMTSHNYENIETLCNEVYVLEEGKLGTLPADEMKRRFRG